MALTRITSDGITDGTITGTDLTTNVDLVDNQKLRLGTGNDLEIYHNGNHSIIHDNGTGDLKIIGDDVIIQATNDDIMAKFIENGAVELYYDNVKKLQTDSAGTVFYDDTFLGDNLKANFGASADLQIFHDGSNSYIEDAGTGALLIKSNTLYLTGTNAANDLASFVEGGAVSLFHNDSKKFETLSIGIGVTGGVYVGTTSATGLGSQTGASNVSTYNQAGITLTQYSVTAGFYYDRLNFTNSQYFIVNSSGTGVYLGNGSTSFTGYSDERLKTNITELDGAKAYNHVKTARAASFNWNATGYPTDTRIGFIAQDWETNYPEVTDTTSEQIDGVENPKGIQYTETIPVLMAALKQAISKIEALETEVAALKAS